MEYPYGRSVGFWVLDSKFVRSASGGLLIVGVDCERLWVGGWGSFRLSIAALYHIFRFVESCPGTMRVATGSLFADECLILTPPLNSPPKTAFHPPAAP